MPASQYQPLASRCTRTLTARSWSGAATPAVPVMVSMWFWRLVPLGGMGLVTPTVGPAVTKTKLLELTLWA